MPPRAATALARAKINLCLHVTGRRPDGYHTLDSLVAFAGVGDRVEVTPAPRTSLTLDGPFGQDLSGAGDNLVLRAAMLMPDVTAAIRLEKSLPVASGIGGGSADAAATLAALAEMSGAPLPDGPAVLSLGADVPVCLHGRTTRMRGIGEVLEPVPPLPPLWCVLANPGVSCSTPEVFAALAHRDGAGIGDVPKKFKTFAGFCLWLKGTRNDLEPAATRRLPVIADVRAAVQRTEGCALARMSGSGATVFGLYETSGAALAAAGKLRRDHRGWWITAAPLEP